MNTIKTYSMRHNERDSKSQFIKYHSIMRRDHLNPDEWRHLGFRCWVDWAQARIEPYRGGNLDAIFQFLHTLELYAVAVPLGQETIMDIFVKLNRANFHRQYWTFALDDEHSGVFFFRNREDATVFRLLI
jgi:hypothetical protein